MLLGKLNSPALLFVTIVTVLTDRTLLNDKNIICKNGPIHIVLTQTRTKENGYLSAAR